MAQFLHLYESENEFQEAYNSVSEIASFSCVSGTFVYDRYDSQNSTYVWTDGTNELWTQTRDAKVRGERQAYDQVNDTILEITSVEEIPGKYIEPWVSYTIGKKPVSVKKFKAIVNGTINGVTYTDEEHIFTVIGDDGFAI